MKLHLYAKHDGAASYDRNGTLRNLVTEATRHHEQRTSSGQYIGYTCEVGWWRGLARSRIEHHADYAASNAIY